MKTLTNEPQVRTPSEKIIPASRGTFYSYASVFTIARPLFCLMDCKANKARPTEDAETLVEEVDMVFNFGDPVRLRSPNSRTTQIARIEMNDYAFDEVRQKKDGEALAQIVRQLMATEQVTTDMALEPGMVLGVATSNNKFGLLRIAALADSFVSIDACHILL